MADNPISAALASLSGIAKNAAKPEATEPGPGDVGPTTETRGNAGLVSLQMSEDEVGAWWQRVDRARARVTAREEKWDILLEEYQPTVEKSGAAETVKVQAHFRNVHSKIGQLFYQAPDLVLEPRDPSPAQDQMPNPMAQMQPPGSPPMPPLTMEDIVSVKQAVLTQKMGRDGIKSNRLFDELLFDVLGWSGIGCSKLGYRCVTKPYSEPIMEPDPNFSPMSQLPGSVIGMGTPPPQPPMVPKIDPMTGQQATKPPVPVPIFEEWYWRRFSPKKALWNDDLKSTRYDEDATWMGMDFYMSPKKAMAQFNLTEDDVNKACEDDRVHSYEEDKQGSKAPPGLIHGVELWVKASNFTDEKHPQAINQLVLIEGISTKPVVWRPSPDQEFDDRGQLTENSLIGFPIRILTVRDLADSPFPSSDSAFTNSEIKQLSTWRRQSIKLRDAQIGKYFYDMDAFDEEDIKNLQDGDVGAYIGVKGGLMAQGADKVFTTTAQIHATNDDYKGATLIKQDIDETLGISSVQAGTPEATVRTATEIAGVATAVAGRNGKELGRVVDFYLDGARMIDQLLMRYADKNEYIHVAGEDGAKRLMMWNNHMISGKYLYDIAPDSQMRVDSETDFKQDLQMYNVAAQDPLFNRAYVLRKMARRRGYDPSKIVVQQPPKPPEKVKPTIGFSFKGEDLVNPIVLQILIAAELLTPEQAQPPGAQPPHGGSAPKGGTVSQHTASQSGKMENAPGASNHRADEVKP